MCPLHNVQRFVSGSSGIKVYQMYMPLWEQGGSATFVPFLFSRLLSWHKCDMLLSDELMRLWEEQYQDKVNVERLNRWRLCVTGVAYFVIMLQW